LNLNFPQKLESDVCNLLEILRHLRLVSTSKIQKCDTLNRLQKVVPRFVANGVSRRTESLHN